MVITLTYWEGGVLSKNMEALHTLTLIPDALFYVAIPFGCPWAVDFIMKL